MGWPRQHSQHSRSIEWTPKPEQGVVRGNKKKSTGPHPRAAAPIAPCWPPALRAGAVAAGVIAVGLAAMLGRSYAHRSAALRPAAESTPVSFVGSQACASCHAQQAVDWEKSQHRAAMAIASDSTVRGDFNGAKLAYAGNTTQFQRRDGKYFVRTDGPDGKVAEFEVKYAFGVEPLQQYLIELSGGRVQALSIAWDSRPKNQHGQRWFHLNPSERITHDDELHWSKPSQNWNFMCADCHSTGLRKNYNADADRFETKWAEINVGCEACHGPGQRHVTWAAASPTDRGARRDSTKGLTARLDERRGVQWTANAATGNATRSHARTSDREIETCAQCHSRRSQIADGYQAGKPFLDYYRPALLSRPLYQADGQQRDEVYTWGSFLQSKMYSRGVTCSDCHNPHSGKLRADGNAVCASCHLPSKYDTPDHHRHQAASAGASCVGCHMPTTTYMVVDPRHDHSLRIPRPDLSTTLGTPNPCASCHANRDAQWAASQLRAWYGHTPATDSHERLARTLAAVDAGAVDAQAQLRALAADRTQPSIARASAFAEWSALPDLDALTTLTAGLSDSSALVRFGALQSLALLTPDVRLRLGAPLLSDARRAIRIEAANVLADMPAQRLSQEQQVAFDRAAGEFIETQRYNADRAEARVTLGTFLAQRGDAARAQEELEAAIRLAPSSIPAYVNLADVYRAQGRDEDGERLLRRGLVGAPTSASLHYALGLVLTRLKRSDTALEEFTRAAGLEPGNARFAYVHAVALNSAGKADAAIAQLKAALASHPANGDLLSALVSFYEARGKSTEAAPYKERLRALATNR
jgi:predicted CXXCH cytochrome family protein